MSRIGNAVVSIPKDVTLTLSDVSVMVKGPKGEIMVSAFPSDITVAYDNDQVKVGRLHEDGHTRALHGLLRAQLSNAVVGVTTGWTRILELSGVGYRATMKGTSLELTVGFSHPVVFTPPDGITFSISEGKIIVSGIDKQRVGEIAAKIREIKKPEPYKGKGIKYQGEYIRKKAGKSAKAVGGAPGAK